MQKAQANQGWIWALAVLVPALLLAFFCWQIIRKAPEEGHDAQENGRALVLSLPASEAQKSAGEPKHIPAVSAPGTSAAPSSPTSSAASGTIIPHPSPELKVAPAEELTEDTPLGPLPKISADGVKPWQYYGRPFTHSGSGPKIAIIVTGLGLSRQASDMALRLPPDMSLSFSPYAPNVPVWAGAARANGHEVLIDIPFEPKDYPDVDPGPYGLLSGQPFEANEQNLRWVLTRFSGYVGGLAPASEHFTDNKEAAKPILQFLAGHGLMLNLGASSLPDQATQMLEKTGLPFLHADVRIEFGMTADDITTQLLAAERLSRAHGSALIIVDASPMAMKALAAWAELLEQKGIVLIPVSALARSKFS